jgi:hypothetical protein
MRFFLACSTLGFALLAAGCHLGPNTRGDVPPPTQTAKQTPPVEQLIDYLNNNAQRLQGVQSTTVAIDANDHGQSIGLAGLLACQKPRNFRLKAKAGGMDQADVGSNDKEFWCWIAQNKPPYVIHCSYDAMRDPQVAGRLPVPFQPDMVLAALGMGDYDKKKNYRLQEYPNRPYYELIEQTTTPQGQPLQRIVVFNRETVDPKSGKPQVIAHALRDDKNNFLCMAIIHSVTVDPATNAILPRKITLKWPPQQMHMTLDMSDIRSATFDADRAASLFRRASMTGVQSFDLARGVVDGPTQ